LDSKRLSKVSKRPQRPFKGLLMAFPRPFKSFKKPFEVLSKAVEGLFKVF